MVNTITLNPAIDKVFFVNEFKRNITNRIRDSKESIGGKGTHVSISLKLMGMGSRAFGLCHGENGHRIREILASHDLEVHFIHRTYGNSRTNYVLVEDNGDTSLIAEKGMPFEEEDLSDLLDLMQKKVSPGDCLVLAGDASNADPEISCRIIKELKAKGLKVFLDTSEKALGKCVSLGPFLIKPNLDELSYLCGRKVSGNVDDVIEGVRSLSYNNIDVIAVSMGAGGSLLCTKEGIYQATPPDLEAKNTAGCGDALLAGLVYGYAKNLPVEESLRLATGAASAKAESLLSAGFDPGKLKTYAEKTIIKRIC